MLLLFRGEYALKEYTEVKTVSDIYFIAGFRKQDSGSRFFYIWLEPVTEVEVSTNINYKI